MKLDMKATGFDQIYAALRNAGDRVADNARKTMHREADKIVKQAKINAPVDKHNLEESIRKEVDYGYRGRLQIDITVGGMVNGVNVDQYAVEVHEHYSSMKPGPNTIAKRIANPTAFVGEKFLERAVKERKEKLEMAIISAVMKEWKL